MAAKEHTENLAKKSDVNNEFRKSLQSENTYGMSSNKEEYNTHENSGAEDNNCFKQGTFAGDQPAVQVEQVDDFQYDVAQRDRNTQQEQGRPHSVISFGAVDMGANQSAQFVKDPDQYTRQEGSLISIRDIQEVRDKVPASPATKLNEPIPYF